eukprot:gene36003-46776_t
MARSSSRSSSPRRSAPAPARVPPPPAARPPAPAPAAPMSQPQSGGMLSGLASTMAQGFAFGTGSAIAREAVGAVMGGSRSAAPPAQQAAPAPQTPSYSGPAACEMDHREFLACLQRNSSNSSSCGSYYSALQQCQSSGSN